MVSVGKYPSPMDPMGYFLSGNRNLKRFHVEIDVSSRTRSSRISSTEMAFAALLGDGTVLTWGDPDKGGDSRALEGVM